ncbi:MAG: hypothetical protein HKP48_07175 [Winogradskyella sp.]|uniref:hypothetical protein n=1 Tax=Winogradskyella sp. TaxID=1883156 RepID=UPI0017FDFE3E|nr:hypothetical protein [Winogradskyella sp.]MBT8245864.1 hypothetical protein [Winogradskyella sp.]NNK23065.1 hypothetical protein [Winogradskyella sp.]
MINKGIWIDKEKAHIISLLEDRVDLQTIAAEADEDKFQKEERQGALEILKDRKVLERQKLKTKYFFKAITSKLKDTKNLIIIGPSQMGQQFAKVLREDYKQLGEKIQDVIKLDKMTDNQLKAYVKDFYSK